MREHHDPTLTTERSVAAAGPVAVQAPQQAAAIARVLGLQRTAGNRATVAALHAAGRRAVARQIAGLDAYRRPHAIPRDWVETYVADLLDDHTHLYQLDIYHYMQARAPGNWMDGLELINTRGNHWDVRLWDATREVVVKTKPDGNCAAHVIAAILDRNRLLGGAPGDGYQAGPTLIAEVRQFTQNTLLGNPAEIQQRIADGIRESDFVATAGFGPLLQDVLKPIEKEALLGPSASTGKASGGAAPETRAGALVQFGVQAHLGERDPIVTSIDFGGRPHGLFGSRHGSHTTAWVVMCDAVRVAVLKQPVMEAIGRLEKLIAEASVLPGADRWRVLAMADDIQVSGENERTGAKIYADAQNEAHAALRLARAAQGQHGLAVAALQELAAAYLKLRNATPLSVTLDVDVARGHGEGAVRAGLRHGADTEAAAAKVEEAKEKEQAAVRDELEQAARGGVQGSKERLRTLLWKLLDGDAVLFLARTEPPGTGGRSPVPGNIASEKRARRVADTVAQHLFTIRRAYPDLYAGAGMLESDDALPAWLKPLANDAVDDAGTTVLAAVREQLARPFEVMKPAVALREIAATPRGAVQITVADDGSGPYVKALRFGSRPTGVLGNEEGAHLTAFGLVQEGLRSTIQGRPLAEVPATVLDLLERARKLPTARRVSALEALASGYYEGARDAAATALGRLRTMKPDDIAYVAALQELLGAYMRFRNTLPLAATSEGGVPGGKAEGPALGVLRAAEKALREAASAKHAMEVERNPAVLDAMWALIDSGALRAIASSQSKMLAPGIAREANPTAQRDESAKRIGDVVATHVKTVKRAFPLCAAEYELSGKDSILEFLAGNLPRGTGTDASLARQEDALTLEDDEAARVATYIATGMLPPAAAEREALGRRTSTRTRKRPREFGEQIGEGDFVQLEEAEEHEAELIARPTKRLKPTPTAPMPDFDFTQIFFGK